MNTCESKDMAVHVQIVLKVSMTWGRLAVCEEVRKTCWMSEEHMGCQQCVWDDDSRCGLSVLYVGLWQCMCDFGSVCRIMELF